jgi:hypothetical protein
MYFNQLINLIQKLNKEAGEIAYLSYHTDGYSEYIEFLEHMIVFISRDNDEFGEDDSYKPSIEEIELQIRKDVRVYLNNMNKELSKLIK